MGLVRSRPGPHNQSMHRATKPWIAWPGVLCLGLLIGQPMWACLWIDGTSLEGSKRRISGVSMAQRLRASLASTPRLKDPGDSPEAQAVADLLEGRINQAVEQPWKSPWNCLKWPSNTGSCRLIGLSGSTTDVSHLGALTSGCERPKWRFSGFL